MFFKITNNFFNNSFYFPFKDLSVWSFIIKKIQKRKEKTKTKSKTKQKNKQLEFPLPNNSLCQVWLKLAEWFCRRSRKCQIFTDGQTNRVKTDRQTDTRQKLIRKAHFSSGEQKQNKNPKNVKLKIKAVVDALQFFSVITQTILPYMKLTFI